MNYLNNETTPQKRVRGPDKKPRPSGPNHGNYIHGQGKNREYDFKKLEAWRQAVYARYGYKCFISTKQGNLVCHHLNGWDTFEELRYIASNGVLLCKSIHDQFHASYGHGGNPQAQFEQFCSEEYGITTFPWQKENHEPSLTTEAFEEKIKKAVDLKREELISLINSRGHQLIAGEQFNSYSKITVKCLKHNEEHTTTVTNYKKSKTGMPCCGKEFQGISTAYYNTLRKK